MKNITRNLIFSFVCVCLISPALFAKSIISKEDKALDLNATVYYSLMHSPVLDAIRRELNISKLNLKNSIAPFFPSVDASSINTVSTAEGRDHDEISGLGANITQNIYNNGSDYANYKINKLQYGIILQEYRKTRDQLIRTVGTDFLNLSLQRKLYAIQKSSLDVFNEQYKSTLAKHHEGLITEKDVVRFYNDVQRQKIGLLQARNGIEQAEKQLLTDLGIDFITNNKKIRFKTINLPVIKIASVPTQTPLLTQQPQYKAFLLQYQINHLNVYLARREYWPRVNLEANAFYGNNLEEGIFGGIAHDKRWDANAILEIKYNLFDAGTRGRNITIAKEEGWQVVDNLTDELLVLKQTIEVLMLNLHQNKLSYQISADLQRSELRNYQSLNTLYRNGKVSYLDLSTAINDLFSAQTRHITDRYTLEKDIYDYYYYRGNIYDQIK